MEINLQKLEGNWDEGWARDLHTSHLFLYHFPI